MELQALWISNLLELGIEICTIIKVCKWQRKQLTKFTNQMDGVTTMKKYLIALIWVSVLALNGCSRVSQEAQRNDSINVEVVSPVFSPIVGTDELVLRVTDAQSGAPVSDAYLSVKGDMTHTGMVPVLSSAKTGIDGEYAIPFEWTMGGDWILTVTVSMPDGSLVERNFNLVVDGDNVTCAPIPEE